MILSRIEELIKLARQFMSQGYSPMDAIKLAEIVLDEIERKNRIEEYESKKED